MKRKTPTYQTLPTDAPIWASEPFRVFFPLGIAATLAGVLLWPLYYAGLWPVAPLIQHPRLMVFGFGAAFVAGFLGTAWPRFLEAEAMRRGELLLLATTWLLTQGLYLANQVRIGDAAFAGHALALILILGQRLRRAEGPPPPGFTLAFLSVILAFAVALTWALEPAWLSDPGTYRLSQLLAWQGTLLLPILGVGSYLFARFFQVPGERPPTAPPGRRAAGVWAAAILVLLSFGVEASGLVRVGNALRLVAILTWMFLAAPAVWQAKAPTTRAWALRVGLGTMALAFLVRAAWPGPAQSLPHLLFLSGFGMTMLLVADRVTLGHCAPEGTARPRSTFWRWLVWLILLTAATRVSADMKASILVSHHIYAAVLWAGIAGFWAWRIGRWWGSRDVE